jgi:hypothetical protein
MITCDEALKNPELMIKYKEDLKNIKIFRDPWYRVFWRYPYLYREFSDRFDEMVGWDVHNALIDDPTLALDLRDYLYILEEAHSNWVLRHHPELSLCLKYKDHPDRAEVAYYVGYPHALDNLDKEEKREMSKRIIELLREEKT